MNAYQETIARSYHQRVLHQEGILDPLGELGRTLAEQDAANAIGMAGIRKLRNAHLPPGHRL